MSVYWDEVRTWLLGFIPAALGSIIILLVGWYGSYWVKRLVDRIVARVEGDEIVWGYLGTIIRYSFLGIMVVSALKHIGFPVESLLVTLGVTGAIVGMGARRSVANYFAGLMMLGAKPFVKGDLIEFGPPPQMGFVTDVNLSYTGLTTVDNAQVIVPNAVLWRNKIINHSRYDMRVLQITLAVAHDVDLDWVKDIALAVLQEHEDILDEPVPRFRVMGVAASEVQALLLGWTTARTVNLYSELITVMRQQFALADLAVTIPAKDTNLTGEEYLWQKGNRARVRDNRMPFPMKAGPTRRR